MFQICVPSRPSWYTQWLSTTGPPFRASQLFLCILIRAWECLPRPYIEISSSFSIWGHVYVRSPCFGPHCYSYVIFWYEHGNARLVHIIRWSLIHYWDYVLFSPCRWFEIGVPDFSCFLLFSTPQNKPNMTHDVHRPYDELLPSHIRGQSVNTQKRFNTSSTPSHGSFVHFHTIFSIKNP